MLCYTFSAPRFLAARFGTEIGDSNYSSRHDLTQDGAVDFADFLEFAAAFGKSV